MADSKSLSGGIVVSMIACLFGESTQLSLLSSKVGPLYRSSFGSVRAPAMPVEGPIARSSTFFGCGPVTMKPPMSTLSPCCTATRVEMFPSTTGPTGLGVGLGLPAGVGVGVVAGVAVGVGVGVGLGGGTATVENACCVPDAEPPGLLAVALK